VKKTGARKDYRTLCRNCLYCRRVPSWGKRQVCHRHRLDGTPHIVPQTYLSALMGGSVRCSLFRHAGAAA
jgi:hypothetical protein